MRVGLRGWGYGWDFRGFGGFKRERECCCCGGGGGGGGFEGKDRREVEVPLRIVMVVEGRKEVRFGGGGGGEEMDCVFLLHYFGGWLLHG